MKCKHISITKISHWWFNWKCRGCNKRFKWLSTLDYLMMEQTKNKETEADWIPTDGKWHSIDTNLQWLPDGSSSYKVFLDGELVSINGVLVNQNKEDEATDK